MKRKKLFSIKNLILLGISFLLILFMANIVNAVKIEKIEGETRNLNVKVTADSKMKKILVYKEDSQGRFILFYKAKPNSKDYVVTISESKLSTEAETKFKIVVEEENGTRNVGEITGGKLTPYPSMNPSETAKPSWSPTVIPTKPTPSIHPSEIPGPSGSGEITGIKLNKNSVTLKIGQTDKLTYTVTPEGVHPHLVWRTDANEICSIEADGTIKGVSIGEATISIKADNGVMDICEVKVVEETTPSPSNTPTPSGSTAPVPSGSTAPSPSASGNPAPPVSGDLEVHYINPNSRVDAIYIKVGDKGIYIDGGFHSDAKKEIEYMNRIGVQNIDYYICSHAHSNHVGAGGPILLKYGIKQVICSKAVHNGQPSAKYMMLNKATTNEEKAAVKAANWMIWGPGDSLDVNGLKITCLGPMSITKTSPGDTAENHNSLILRMDYGSTSFLFVGDTGSGNLSDSNKAYPNKLNTDVYKNAHHNGTTSTSVLKAIAPKYVVFTTQDKYMPSSSYLSEIKKLGAQYFIVTNNHDQNVLITSDGTNLKVKTKN